MSSLFSNSNYHPYNNPNQNQCIPYNNSIDLFNSNINADQLQSQPKKKFSSEPQQIFIKNLDPQTIEYDFRKMFEEFGRTLSIRLATDETTGTCKGYGFISFRYRESAIDAVDAMNNKIINGKKLIVQLAKTTPQTFKRYKPQKIIPKAQKEIQQKVQEVPDIQQNSIYYSNFNGTVNILNNNHNLFETQPNFTNEFNIESDVSSLELNHQSQNDKEIENRIEAVEIDEIKSDLKEREALVELEIKERQMQQEFLEQLLEQED